QDVGRDVVRKIAYDVGCLAFGDKRAQVRFEHVGLDDLDLRLVAEAEGQLGGEGAVEFERDEPAAAGGEYFGDGSVAGANLDDGPFANIAKCVCDGVAGAV